MRELIEKAKACGFTCVVPLNPSVLSFLPDVRAMCEANRCGLYGKRWSCPPACGDLSVLEARARGYGSGLLLQTTVQLEDSFDFEGMQEASRRHKHSFYQLADALHAYDAAAWLMPAGGCELCKTCTYPDAPCRHPDLAAPSMEACGLLVSDVCKSCGVPYSYGPNTLTYVSCALFHQKEGNPA